MSRREIPSVVSEDRRSRPNPCRTIRLDRCGSFSRPPWANDLRQPSLQGALSRRLALGVEPTPKILHADSVLDGGLADAHPQFRKPVADLLDPGVLMQNRQRPGDRFVQ